MGLVHPPLECFPKDGKTYRIYWAGQFIPQAFDSNTPRIAVWLREEVPIPADIPVPTVLIWESAGSIPAMPIGSYWRDQVYFDGPLAKDEALEDLVLAPQAVWSAFRAGDRYPASRTDPADPRTQAWLNPSDMRLIMSDQQNQRVHGYKAWVVPAQNRDGKEVLIPSYELFRAFYAGTSELAVTLLTKPWDDSTIDTFIEARSQSGTAQLPEWNVTLRRGIPDSAIRYLGMLVFEQAARKIAATVYPSLVYNRQFELENPWISVVPPMLNRPLRIRARVKRLPSRGAFLVQEIIEAHYPSAVAKIHAVLPQETKPFSANDSEGKDQPGSVAGSSTGVTVGPAVDRRPGMRQHQLASPGPVWIDPPEIARTAIRTRYVPKPEPTDTEIPPVESLSVGADGRARDVSRGTFSAQEAQEVFDRFAALRTTLGALQTSGEIVDWTEVPLVNPLPVGSPRYCGFPPAPENRIDRWAIISHPQPRPRLAWVLNINRTTSSMYWIESEARRRSDLRCSLLFRLSDGNTLTASMLQRLLAVCVEHAGVWPESPPKSMAGEIRWAKIRHRFDGDAVTISCVLRGFKKLES